MIMRTRGVTVVSANASTLSEWARGAGRSGSASTPRRVVSLDAKLR